MLSGISLPKYRKLLGSEFRDKNIFGVIGEKCGEWVRNMLYLRLAGGLGNQLYQVSAANLIAARSFRNVILITDGLNQYKQKRKFDLENIVSIPGCFKINQPPLGYLSKIAILQARCGRWIPIVGINDKNFWKHIRRPSQTPIQVMDGYFQRGWTMDVFREALRNIIVNETTNGRNKIVGDDEVTIHVRGGDFLTDRNLNIVGEKYYYNAVLLAQKSGWKRYVIISDDYNYAAKIAKALKELLPNISLRILTGTNSMSVDFHALRCASARIIGNSTFAWWASALGDLDSATWSPSQFNLNCNRDFFLPFEVSVKIS